MFTSQNESPLQKFKREADLTDDKLAELFGVTRTFVSRLRKGTRKPSRETAIRIEEKTDGKIPVRAWS